MPTSGRLFTSKISSDTTHYGYHGVAVQVKRLAEAYEAAHPLSGFARIRTHSGRASAITAMMAAFVPLPQSLKFARHSVKSLETHLGYGVCTCKTHV
jgi:hypothetical protein